MKWFSKNINPFHHLDPEKGPEESFEVKECGQLVEFPSPIGHYKSYENFGLKLLSVKIEPTFLQSPSGTPWSASVKILKDLGSQKISILNLHLVKWPIEIPKLSHLCVALPPYKFSLHFISEDYAPEEDESCYSSEVYCIWFSENLATWKEDLAQDAKNHLLWESIAKPCWRS